ncbi:hypothetical protein K438DRAFT_1800809 [Mycena galopus ATCC 62051]|nr:hypothetical protein K438DRAFT_1800809 [Mycena galopus ATCC 62051]
MERIACGIGSHRIIAIQRAVHKILISVFLSREFKHDEINRAGGMDGAWGPTSCCSPHENLSSRLLSCRSGAPISSSDTSSYLC